VQPTRIQRAPPPAAAGDQLSCLASVRETVDRPDCRPVPPRVTKADAGHHGTATGWEGGLAEVPNRGEVPGKPSSDACWRRAPSALRDGAHTGTSALARRPATAIMRWQADGGAFPSPP
jgi:hypothetical protein